MIVVEAFASGQPGKPPEVPRRIWPVTVTMMVTVTKAIDGSRKKDIRHAMHRKGDDPGPETEDEAPDGDAERNSDEAVIEEVIEPVSLDVLRIHFDCLRILGFPAVVLDVRERDFPHAILVRAMRIAFFISVGMMLTMHRYPFPPDQSGLNPLVESYCEIQGWVELKAPVRKPAVQVDGCGEGGDVENRYSAGKGKKYPPHRSSPSYRVPCGGHVGDCSLQ